jgi:hypothetical protein
MGSDHGTFVMGIMAGAWGGGDPRGIAGVLGPASSGMLSCNCFASGTGEYSDTVTATLKVGGQLQCSKSITCTKRHTCTRADVAVL